MDWHTPSNPKSALSRFSNKCLHGNFQRADLHRDWRQRHVEEAWASQKLHSAADIAKPLQAWLPDRGGHTLPLLRFSWKLVAWFGALWLDQEFPELYKMRFNRETLRNISFSLNMLLGYRVPTPLWYRTLSTVGNIPLVGRGFPLHMYCTWWTWPPKLLVKWLFDFANVNTSQL